MAGRITLALYNSYDQTKFREAHRRALARSGALAAAFDMNLVTFGFPFPEGSRTPKELADWVASTTSIGHDGDYFSDIAEKGRFQSFPYPSKGFPPQLGEAILTTSRPDPKRSISANDVYKMVKGGQSVLLLFGLGPHGVPKDAASIPKYNLDITNKGYSLETCTALGAVAGAMFTLQYLS